MLLMHANDREDIQVAYAGDIVALAGLKDTTHRRHAVRRAEADHPRADGIPRSGHRGRGRAQDQGRPGEDGRRAQSLGAEDPSFRVTTDHESGQTIIKGMGELHLEIIVDRMKREFKVEANVGAPQVAYREISREAGRDRLHPQEAVGRLAASSREIKIAFEPGEPGTGFDFIDEIMGGNVPKEYIPSVEKGLAKRREPACWPASRSSTSRSTLIDGKYHDVDSSALAFEIAARGALREAAQKAGINAARADHEGRGRDARRLYSATSSAT